ncbi:Iron/zinc purple acid phosphatase-like protein, partial [Leptotrombidium deliense]
QDIFNFKCVKIAAKPSEIVVTWITYCPSVLTHVKYISGKRKIRIRGNMTQYTNGDREYFVHRTLLKRLKPDQIYCNNYSLKSYLQSIFKVYRCGNDNNWSSMYSFKTLKDGENWSPIISVFGDLDTDHHSLLNLIDDVKKHKFNILYHIGDFGYEAESNERSVRDVFYTKIEEITARVAYLTVPVNKEQTKNSSNYNNRFSMVNVANGEKSNFYYSVNIGTAHIICFSTEFQYSMKKDSKYQIQFEWLKNDLIAANTIENRRKRPWIITMAHRPMVCSNYKDECATKRNHMKVSFERLFYKYGVDLQMWGGGYSYQRFWPFFEFKVRNGSLNEPYKNPKAPVNIITAFDVQIIIIEYFKTRPIDTTLQRRNKDHLKAVTINKSGYTRLTVMNRTHLHIEYVSSSTDEVADEVMIIKTFHGSYNSKSNLLTPNWYTRTLICSFAFLLSKNIKKVIEFFTILLF